MHLFLVCNQDVLWFDVSVNNVPVLKVEQRLNDLCDDYSRFVLGEEFLSAQLLVEISVLAVLKHNVDTLCVVKVAIQSHDVWVV